MSERPFMQLYVSDFIGDTLSLSTEQIGAYMLLLMAMWNAGGKLPADEGKLARVTRLSVKKWKAIAGDLLPFFETDGGIIRHNRLTKELQKSESKSQSRASAGAEGGRAKALKDKETRLANATRTPQHYPDTITREDTSSLRSDVCPEPENSAPATQSPSVIDLPATQGQVVAITESDVAEWRAAFPAVDVPQQLRAMRQWLLANERNRKTVRGMRKFVVSWLSRDQDRGGARQHQSQAPPRQSAFRQHQDEIYQRLKRETGDRDDQFAGTTLDIGPGDYRPH